MKTGVLPDFMIKKLIDDGVIINADPNLVGTSGLDLRTGLKKWKLLGDFIPLPGQKIEEAFESKNICDSSSTRERFYLDRSQPYAIELKERLFLPSTIGAKIFNKSSRARVAVASKGLTDGTPHFDIVPNEYNGKLYSEVSTTAFPLVINEGDSISQIRFYQGNPDPITGSQLEVLLKNYPILTDDCGNPAYDAKGLEHIIRTGRLTFTADLSQEGVIAYIANKDGRNFDLSVCNTYRPEDYFNEVRYKNGGGNILIIHPGDFVLIRSRENIRLPPSIAAEIAPYTTELGDMKTSYANLINCKHGWGIEKPSYIIFEIRALDTPIIIQHSQQLAKIDLYCMLEEPEGNYIPGNTDFEDLKSLLPGQFKKD